MNFLITLFGEQKNYGETAVRRRMAEYEEGMDEGD